MFKDLFFMKMTYKIRQNRLKELYDVQKAFNFKDAIKMQLFSEYYHDIDFNVHHMALFFIHYKITLN